MISELLMLQFFVHKSQLKLRFIQPVFGVCHLTREFVLYLVVFKIWITDRTLKLLGRTKVRQS